MTATTVPQTEAAATVRTWLSAFSDALASNETTEAAALFTGIPTPVYGRQEVHHLG
jgi:hypothetical protein